jgi:LysM repeat protein
VAVGAGGEDGGSVAPTPAPAAATSYVVVRGDNYYRIAQKFGVSVAALYQVNHITNTSILFIGTVLTIPAQSAGN